MADKFQGIIDGMNSGKRFGGVRIKELDGKFPSSKSWGRGGVMPGTRGGMAYQSGKGGASISRSLGSPMQRGMVFERDASSGYGRRGGDRLHVNQLQYHFGQLAHFAPLALHKFVLFMTYRAQRVFQENIYHHRFHPEGVRTGGKWAPLSPRTRRNDKWLAKKGIVRKGILHMTSDLYKSLRVKASKDALGNVRGTVYTDPGAFKSYTKVGLRDFCYAGIHNEGGSVFGGSNVPRRQFIGHTQEFRHDSRKWMDYYLFWSLFDSKLIPKYVR